MTDVATNAELEALKKDAGIPHLPTQLTFEARLAICGEGPRAYDWSDKPHRIVYDLCREIERNAALPAVQPDPLCECGMTGPCKWTECKAPILSAHVSQTPKSEHDAANMLTPATKGGA